MSTLEHGKQPVPRKLTQNGTEILSLLGSKMEHRPNGCIIWQGTMHADNSPIIKINGQQVRIRPQLYRLSNPNVGRVRVYNTCGNPRCVSPAHASTVRPERDLVHKLAYYVITEEGCHVRPKQEQRQVYAKIQVNGKSRLAHRVAYENKNGPIPPGKEIHHKCNNKACFNPDHLMAVEPHENKKFAQQDGLMQKPRAKGKENGNTRIGFVTKLNVMDAREKGITYTRIRRNYGVSISTARKIVKELRSGPIWISPVIKPYVKGADRGLGATWAAEMRLVENGQTRRIFLNDYCLPKWEELPFSLFDSYVNTELQIEEAFEYRYLQGALGELKNVIK